MRSKLHYATFRTNMGWAGVLGSSSGLLATTLPQSSAQQARQQLGDGVNFASWSPNSFKDLITRLGAYFYGAGVSFPDKLDLSQATPFQREVWEITRRIPYGETRSYGWVAEQTGKPEALRAVGQALRKNPLPIIIPCHRVVATSGRPGGFSGGAEMKQRLLSLEATGKKH